MNSRVITVKDDRSDYIIYYPYPCTALPPIGPDIPPEGCQCLSIDPAIKTFSITIEKRYAHGYIETIYMANLDFSPYGDVNESTGTTAVSPGILAAITAVIQQLLTWISECRLIVVERPLAKNYKTSRVYQHLLTYFSAIAPTFKHYCLVMDVSPKLKGRVLGAPPHLNYNGLKAWAVDKAIELYTWRGDQTALNFILAWKKKGKTAASDPSDAAIQLEALLIALGGVHTAPPLTILLH